MAPPTAAPIMPPRAARSYHSMEHTSMRCGVRQDCNLLAVTPPQTAPAIAPRPAPMPAPRIVSRSQPRLTWSGAAGDRERRRAPRELDPERVPILTHQAADELV